MAGGRRGAGRDRRGEQDRVLFGTAVAIITVGTAVAIITVGTAVAIITVGTAGVFAGPINVGGVLALGGGIGPIAEAVARTIVLHRP